MEPALPMPPVEELDVMFSELVVSLRLHFRGGWEPEGGERIWTIWLDTVLPFFGEKAPICVLTVSTEPVEKKEKGGVTTSEGLLLLKWRDLDL